MALPMQVEFVKLLACLAWADDEVTNAELNFIKQFVRRFDLSGDEWAQVEMYLVEKVGIEEKRRVARRFLARVRRSRDRQMLLDTVEQLLHTDGRLTDAEQEWLRDLRETVSGARGSAFVLDGFKSLLRIGGASGETAGAGREVDLHDFIHNRVLFKLRRRLGPELLEKQGSPEKLKKLTLSATLLCRVGFVDTEFLSQEEAFMRQVLHDVWGTSPPMAEAVARLAVETAPQGSDLYRLVQEVKATMSAPERKRLLEGIFALSMAEGKMSNEEIEEIRKIATMLDFTHRQFIAAKLKALRPAGEQ